MDMKVIFIVVIAMNQLVLTAENTLAKMRGDIVAENVIMKRWQIYAKINYKPK